MRKSLLWFLIIILIVSNLLISFANSAAPRILPDQMKVIFREDTGIALNHEKIDIEFDSDFATATYHVVYQLENKTDRELTYPMWFLSGGYENSSFQVWDEGSALEVKLIEPESYHIENWEPILKPPFVTPLNQTMQSDLRFYGQPSMQPSVLEWQLTMAPGEFKEIVFQYVSKNGYLNQSDYLTRYKTQYYALSPALFFEGEATADIQLHVPKNSVVGSNLVFNKSSEYVYDLVNYKIDQEDLYLTILNSKELIMGLNSRMRLFEITLPAFILLAVLSFLFRKRKVIMILCIIGSIAALALNFLRPSYGTVMILFFSVPVIIIGVTAYFAGCYFYKKNKVRRIQMPK